MNITTLKQNNLTIVMALAITTLLALAFILLLSPTKATAATITVGGACSLDDAVASMNAGSDQSGCVGTGTYGTNDTITIPAGTYSYTNSASIVVPVTLQGVGMGETIVDCGGNNEGFFFANSNPTPLQATIQDMSVINSDESPANGTGAIASSGFSMNIRRVEIYANTSQEVQNPIAISNQIDGLSSIVEDVYIHDITYTFGAISVASSEGATSSNNIIRRVTVSNVTGTSAFGVQGINVSTYDNGGSVEATIENISLSDILTPNTSNTAYILGTADSSISGGDGSTDLTVRNVTIVGDADTGENHAPIVAFAAAPSGDTAVSNVDFQNILASNVSAIGGSFTFGAGGTESATITSLGGNIIDGPSTPELNHPTDQSGVANLASTLSPLQDNGGLTPTIALLSGSPAIDAGVTNSLSSDQRGIARPQGSAYDSGAFELAIATEQPTTNQTGASQQLANTEQARNLLLVAAAVLVATPFVLMFAKRLRA